MKYEVRPVKYLADSAAVCPENEATTFGVYFNLSDGTQEHIADIDDKANAELVADLLNDNRMVIDAPTQGKWYAVDKDGQATLCVDKQDAINGAKEYAEFYPKNAPYRIGQMIIYDLGAKKCVGNHTK